MNQAQELQLLRLRLGSFNNLDGDKVADDLKEHEGLWRSFVFGGFEYQPLIELRDLPRGVVNADTLYLLTNKDRLGGVLDLVQRWKADEIGWLTENGASGVTANKSAFDLIGAFLGTEDVLVRVWWD